MKKPARVSWILKVYDRPPAPKATPPKHTNVHLLTAAGGRVHERE